MRRQNGSFACVFAVRLARSAPATRSTSGGMAHGGKVRMQTDDTPTLERLDGRRSVVREPPLCQDDVRRS
jgi:hypothetical protein